MRLAFRRVQEWASRIALRLLSRAFSSPAFSRADRRLGQAAPQAPNLEGDEPVQPTKIPRSVCALIGAALWSATGIRAFSLRFHERGASPCFYVIRQGHGSTDVTHGEAKAFHLDCAFGRHSRDDGTSVVVNEHALHAFTDFAEKSPARGSPIRGGSTRSLAPAARPSPRRRDRASPRPGPWAQARQENDDHERHRQRILRHRRGRGGLR